MSCTNEARTECGKTIINGEPISAENNAVDIPCIEWSEEDEENLGKLHRLLVICQGEKKFIPSDEYDKLDNWLKSLRPSWKPSEDEERLINTSISFLKDFADKGYENAVECIDWLKSKIKNQKKIKLNGNTCK